MDDDSAGDEIAALARRAGLDRALAAFPADVAEAVRAADTGRLALRGELAPDVEPYPPVRPA